MRWCQPLINAHVFASFLRLSGWEYVEIFCLSNCLNMLKTTKNVSICFDHALLVILTAWSVILSIKPEVKLNYLKELRSWTFLAVKLVGFWSFSDVFTCNQPNFQFKLFWPFPTTKIVCLLIVYTVLILETLELSFGCSLSKYTYVPLFTTCATHTHIHFLAFPFCISWREITQRQSQCENTDRSKK